MKILQYGCCLFFGLSLCFSAEAQRPRARELGIIIGKLPTGKYNAITDVEGVRVGHVTLIKGEGKLVVGKGPVRTGVTAILPHGDDIFNNLVFAATDVLNGNGEMTGTHWINERGLLEVPIMLTNTLSVGTVYDGVVSYSQKQDIGRVPLPVVAECWDGELNDIAGRHVTKEHAIEAIESAKGGPVAEGSVGAGTGMRYFGYKAGIGTSSRVLPEEEGGYTIGVLVNANIGPSFGLRIDGVPAGDELALQTTPLKRDGSIVTIIATDAPLLPHQLKRLCKRAMLGMARTGAVGHTGSGDLFLAFSTAQRITENTGLNFGVRGPGTTLDQVQVLRDGRLTEIFIAVVDATEEAIVNSLCVADTMVGKNGRTKPGIPHDKLVEIMKRYHRIK